jgi:hypothetical protein
MYENGSLGTQSVLDNLDDSLNKGTLGELVKQSRGASLAQDAGKVGQEAVGKHVGEFGQWVGQLTAWSRGLQESVVGPVMAGIGAGLLTIFRGPIAATMGAVLSGSAVGAGGVMQSLLSPLKALQGGLGNLFTSVTGWVKNIGVTFNWVKAASLDAGSGGFMSNVRGAVAGLIEGGKGISSGLSSILRGFGGFVRAFGPLAGLINAAVEIFTGDVASALNPEGGFFNRLGGIVTAFFTAIPNFIIDALGYVFGDDVGTWLQNKADVFVAAASGLIRDLFGKVFEGWGKILSWVLPDDSKLVKNLQEWGKNAQESARSNYDAVGELVKNGDKTLKTIAGDNKKAAEKTTSTTKDSTTKAQAAQSNFNNVMSAGALTAAGAIQDAKALIASPQVQVPKSVAPATVNTDEQQAQTTAAAKSTSAPDNSEMLNVLNAMLQVLRDTLVSESHQAENSDAMLRLLRPQTTFSSAQGMSDKLLKRD